jgi:hypothetical protein
MVSKRFIQAATMTLLLCLSGPTLADSPVQYHLDITCDTGGYVQVAVIYPNECDGYAGEVSLLLNEGLTVQAQATAFPGWHFTHWIGTVGYNDPNLSLTMNQDWNLHACFELNGPTLVVTCGNGGKVVQPGVGSFMYKAGNVVTIQAEPNDGYRFSGWTGSAVDMRKVTDPNSAKTTVTMDTGYTIRANFVVVDYTLTVSSGLGGSVTMPGIGAYSYPHGTVVVIGTKPDTGYHFVNWTGSAVDALKVADPNSASTTVTVNDNYTLKANFAANQHVLTVISDTGGSVLTTASWRGTSSSWTGSGIFTISDGALIQMTAIANAGWHFTHWSGTTDANQATLAFTLTADRTVEAYFAQDERTLSISASRGGTVSKPGIGLFSYDRGTIVPIEATANSGYRFVNWTGSVVDANDVVDPHAGATSVIVDASGTLTANFETLPQDFRETWESARVGSVTPSATAYVLGDAGVWAVRDAVSCVTTSNRAEIVSSDGDQALKVTSVNNRSTCSDRAWVLLGASDSPNLWLGVAIGVNTVISFDEVGQLCSPALHISSKNPVFPVYDNISLILTDNNGNTLVYVLQRYASATANLGNSSDSYREIFLDPAAIKYQRNLFTDFLTIPAFKPTGALVQSIEFRVDAHGTAILDNLIIGRGTVIAKVPVYRFWSPSSEEHYYTTSETERERLSSADPRDWLAEGIAYYALPNGADSNSSPVYRFWAPTVSSHFWTISESEKTKLLTQFSNLWTFEGVYFYGYSASQRPADAVPLYRFWSGSLGEHFYTTYEAERDKVIRMNPSYWVFEGVAWYVYPPWPFASALTGVSCSN